MWFYASMYNYPLEYAVALSPSCVLHSWLAAIGWGWLARRALSNAWKLYICVYLRYHPTRESMWMAFWWGEKRQKSLVRSRETCYRANDTKATVSETPWVVCVCCTHFNEHI